MLCVFELLPLASDSQAGTLYFSNAGGPNAWDATTKDWSSQSGGPYGQAWGNGSVAVFEGTAGNVNVSGSIASVNSVVFGVDGYALNGGTITLTVGGVTNNGAATVSSVIAGSAGLTKLGTSQLILSGANSYTGSTYIGSGTLQLSGGSNRLPTATAVSLANTAGATLDLNGNNQTIASLSGGGTAGGNVTLGAGTLTLGNNNSETYAGVISGAGGLVKQGSGTLALAGVNTYTGPTTINAGALSLLGANCLSASTAVSLANASYTTLAISGDQTIASLSGGGNGSIVTGAGSLTVGDATSTTFSGALQQNGNLIKQGAGTLTLSCPSSGGNSYLGSTIINAGTLRLSGSGRNVPDTPLVLANVSGATLDINGQMQDFASISGGGTSGGNVTLGAGTLFIDGFGTSSYAGAISGIGGNLAVDSGVLILSGASSYSGATTVQGTLRLSGGDNRLPIGTAVVLPNVNGAVLDLNGQNQTIASLSGGGYGGGNVTLGSGTLTVGDASSTTYAGIISGAGGLIKQGAGTLTFSGANTCTGKTTINGGVLQLYSGNATFGSCPVVGDIENNATLVIDDNYSSTTCSGLISGSGVLNIGGYSVTLNGANTYTGDTTFAAGAGWLILGNSKALQNSTLDLTGTNVTPRFGTLGSAILGGLKSTYSGFLALCNDSSAAVALSVGNNNQLTVYDGSLAGPGSLTKVGTGTLTLDGYANYAGLTTVQAGTLALGPSTQNVVLTGGGADVQGGKLVFNYTAGSDPAATIQGILQVGFATGFATGQIHSSTAAGAGLALGWLDDSVNDQVTVACTLFGDANLDGTVNGGDLNIVLANYNKTGVGWSQGDFNYDSTVNGADLNAVLSNYNQSVSLSSAGAAVPEPGTVVLLAAGLLSLLIVARRKAA